MAATPRIGSQGEPARPTWRPNRPARIAPASGASTIASSTVFEIANSMPGIIPSALQGIDFGHVDRAPVAEQRDQDRQRSEEHTSELQSLMRISYAVFCLKKKNKERKSKIQT